MTGDCNSAKTTKADVGFVYSSCSINRLQSQQQTLQRTMGTVFCWCQDYNVLLPLITEKSLNAFCPHEFCNVHS